MYLYTNNCNVEIHNKMITVEYIDCLLCDQQFKKPSTKHIRCCEKESTCMINDNCSYICISCGSVHGYQIAQEYIDFHENKYKISMVKKSIYERKFHLENTISDICDKCKLYIPGHDRLKMHQIFKEIDKILPQINGDRS